MRAAAAASLAALALLGCRTAPPAEVVTDGRYAMGTLLEISIAARAGTLDRADLAPYFDEIARLETLFSKWDASSALVALNAAAGTGPVAVPAELRRILEDAQAFSARTRGSFDVTIGPLVALWVAAAQRDALPDARALRLARSSVGPDRVALLADGRVALQAGAAVDLAGVAKGWALDRVAARLERDGHRDFLLDFGRSSIVARGAPPGSDGWRVLLESAGEGFAGTLTLRDRALSVSGSVGQWSTIAGERFGHVIDPRSGQPLRETWLATVVAPSGAEAEAWSKALLVLGAEEGLALAEKAPGVEALLEGERGERFGTPHWREASGFAAAK